MPLTIKKPEGTQGSAAPAILIGLFVAFGGVLFGYVLMSTRVASGMQLTIRVQI